MLVLTSRKNSSHFKFDHIETTQFIPNEAYIQECVEASPGRRCLEKPRYRKPIYVITSIKTVSGARTATNMSRTVEGMLGVKLDGTILSGGLAPIVSGSSVEIGRENREDTAWKRSSDFFFPFCVSESKRRRRAL